ncbi:hypothetical protein HQQ81_13965 [Microbacteriaceae bacterium VKM Ac-2854]|nr:hypothetical protein [Microbacteriaceae bacterium VKM Ac-2854]
MPCPRHFLHGASLAAILALSVAGCSTAAAPPTPTGHGFIEGAVEATEPQLHLAAIDVDGALTLLDLIEGDSAVIAELGEVDAASTDGRFVFAARDGALTVVDTGAWTVPHGDHSHYYLAEPRVVGTVAGDGTPGVTPGSAITAVRFDDETVLLDTAALGDGTLVETREHRSDLAAAIGDRPLLAADGFVGDTVCTEPAGTISTVVGTVIGCAEGALLATEDAPLELIPYPAAGRATSFEARKDRPTVAALVDGGVWLLDTRERSWTVLATEPLAQVVAVDDAAERVVALSIDGRVLTLDPATGATLASTEPLGSGTLTVDANRAYLNAAAAVSEIDYRDSVRIARSFDLDAAFLLETGR